MLNKLGKWALTLLKHLPLIAYPRNWLSLDEFDILMNITYTVSTSVSVQYLYLTPQKNSYLAYSKVSGSQPLGITFLHGYHSDMQGTKAEALADFCRSARIPFTRFDYQGHGLSSGEFIEGSIDLWRQNVLDILEHVATGPQILVGSSMGGWLALLAALARPQQILGLIGIAASPDFTERLLWPRLPDFAKAAITKDGIWAPEGFPPVTAKLFDRSRAHLLLDRPIELFCPVHLIQGMCDYHVPWQYVYHIQQQIQGDDVTVTLVKNGDHSLSQPADCRRLLASVQHMYRQCCDEL